MSCVSCSVKLFWVFDLWPAGSRKDTQRNEWIHQRRRRFLHQQGANQEPRILFLCSYLQCDQYLTAPDSAHRQETYWLLMDQCVTWLSATEHAQSEVLVPDFTVIFLNVPAAVYIISLSSVCIDYIFNINKPAASELKVILESFWYYNVFHCRYWCDEQQHWSFMLCSSDHMTGRQRDGGRVVTVILSLNPFTLIVYTLFLFAVINDPCRFMVLHRVCVCSAVKRIKR